MAKKKGKKNAQKQVEVTSAPGSPKLAPAPAVEEPVPEVAEDLEPATETPAVEPTPDEESQTTAEVLDAKIDEAVEKMEKAAAEKAAAEEEKKSEVGRVE